MTFWQTHLINISMEWVLNRKENMTNRVKNTDQTWVVYGHYDNNDLVYIGSGQVHRAWQFIKRSKEHYDWLVKQGENNNLNVRVLYKTKVFEDARFLEGRLIAEYNPKFNKNLNKLTLKDVAFVKKSLKQGKSVRWCSKEIGIYHNNICQLMKVPSWNKEFTDPILLT